MERKTTILFSLIVFSIFVFSAFVIAGTGGTPDLRIRNINNFQTTSCSGNTSTCTLTFNAVVQNIGNGTANFSNTNFFLNNTITGNFYSIDMSTQSLAPGQGVLLNVSVTNVVFGNYTVDGLADSFNAVGESNEVNNGFSTFTSVP